ncbi:MAG: hypothetical protein WCC64_19875 [Aliidongia sp.]
MHHANLFLAAAAVLFGSVAALRAEPLPASNSTEITTRGLGPSENTVPADATPAPTPVPASSPVAEIAVDQGMKGAPQELKSDPIPHAVHAGVPPHRPVTNRARLGCCCSHLSARVAKRAMPRRFAAPQAAVWLVASREPQYVLLGVGY